MKNKIIFFTILFSFLTAPFVAFAASDKNEKKDGQINQPDEIAAYIQYHLKDSHSFNLYKNGKTGKYVGFPLPVIFWDGGLHFFMSSKFDNGKNIVPSKGNFYKLHESRIVQTDANGTIEYNEEGKLLNKRPLDLSITKNVFGVLFAGFLLLFMFSSLARSYKKSQVPTGFAGALEPLVLFVRDEIARPNIGEKKYRNYMGYLLTVFFMIWMLNIFGLTPFGFNITGNIAVTACLALFTFFVIQFTANKDYWKHIFWMPGVPVLIKLLLIPIEVVGMFIKPFSLMLRLFANMAAGNVVLMSLLALAILLKVSFGPVVSVSISLVLSTFLFIIKVLVAFLQAFIFTMLSALFIGFGVAEHDEHH